jgi:hypothetical protein
MSETKLRLSEAIRLGAMMKPQRGILPTWGAKYGEGYCALEAAAVAVSSTANLLSIRDLWPWVLSKAKCPYSCGFEFDVEGAVGHLNDHHRWTREQIADWVATIEAQTEQDAKAGKVEVHG